MSVCEELGLSNHELWITLTCDIKGALWKKINHRTFELGQMLTLSDTGYCSVLEIVNILLHVAIKGQRTVLQHSRLCLEELNGIYCIYQFCPPAKSKRNNTVEIAIS